MKYNSEIHHNCSIRLKGYDYSSEGAYFITICVKDRECLFGEIINEKMNLSEIGKIAHNNLLGISQNVENIEIDEFVIMPNHVHVIIVINKNDVETDNVVGVINVGVGVIHELHLHELHLHELHLHELPLQLNKNIPDHIKRRKMLIPKVVGRYKMNVSKQINQIRNMPGVPLWQRNYYEHIIRSEKSLNAIRKYIIENPLKWELDKENPINIKENKNATKR